MKKTSPGVAKQGRNISQQRPDRRTGSGDRKVLDTADIVRDAIFRELTVEQLTISSRYELQPCSLHSFCTVGRRDRVGRNRHSH